MNKTTLADLRRDIGSGSRLLSDFVPATTQDLIEAVESIGVVLEARPSMFHEGKGYLDAIVESPGRYLILRIEEPYEPA